MWRMGILWRVLSGLEYYIQGISSYYFILFQNNINILKLISHYSQ